MEPIDTRPNVIHLFGPPPAVDGAPSVGDRNWTCYPHGPVVDSVSRSVKCRRCEQQLDPIDVLIQVSRQHEDWKRLLEETSQMRKQLAAMQEEEKRVKARTKSHSRKDAAEAVAAERAKQERERAEVMTRTDDIRKACERIDQLVGRRPRRVG